MLATLLLLAGEENREKVPYLYNTFHKDMLRFAKKRLKHAERADYEADAEDVVQNAFVKLVRYVHRIDFQKSEKELRVYVMSILANEIAALLSHPPARADRVYR